MPFTAPESSPLSGFFPWKGNGLNIKDYTDFLNAVKEVMMEIHAWRLIAILITAVLLVLVWRLPEILNALPPLLRGL